MPQYTAAALFGQKKRQYGPSNKGPVYGQQNDPLFYALRKCGMESLICPTFRRPRPATEQHLIH